MKASDRVKVKQIKQLENAIERLYEAENDFYDLNFDSLGKSDTNRWSGKHRDDFIDHYNKGNDEFKRGRSLINDMIREYRANIRRIAWSIEDLPTRYSLESDIRRGELYDF